jgi:hypothetical protein
MVSAGADMVESKISFDVNINIGHVLCYDTACTMWIGEQNSGSTKGKRGQKNKMDVLLLRNTITDTQKEEQYSAL